MLQLYASIPFRLNGFETEGIGVGCETGPFPPFSRRGWLRH